MNPTSARRFEALGVHRLNLPVRSDLSEEDLVRFVDDVGRDLVA